MGLIINWRMLLPAFHAIIGHNCRTCTVITPSSCRRARFTAPIHTISPSPPTHNTSYLILLSESPLDKKLQLIKRLIRIPVANNSFYSLYLTWGEGVAPKSRGRWIFKMASSSTERRAIVCNCRFPMIKMLINLLLCHFRQSQSLANGGDIFITFAAQFTSHSSSSWGRTNSAPRKTVVKMFPLLNLLVFATANHYPRTAPRN